MAKGIKFNVFVGVVQPDGTTKLVTKIDNKTRWASWSEGIPMKFTLSTAKDLVLGLTMNGYTAVVIQTLVDFAENAKRKESEQ